MREYETTFIIQPEISDEAVAGLLGRVDEIFEKHGSIRLMHDDQGRRRLAYEIDKFQKGRYVMSVFLDEGRAVQELERMLRLDDSILRFLTVQVDDEVKDIDKRREEAAELERVRAARAAERAEREAEESARAAEEEAARRAASAAAEAESAGAGSGEGESSGVAEAGGVERSGAPAGSEE